MMRTVRDAIEHWKSEADEGGDNDLAMKKVMGAISRLNEGTWVGRC